MQACSKAIVLGTSYLCGFCAVNLSRCDALNNIIPVATQNDNVQHANVHAESSVV